MADAKDTAARAAQLLRQGRAAEAAALLEAELAGAPGDPAAERLLIQCLAQAGDLNAALDRQLALVPSDISNADAQARADTLGAAHLAQLAMDYPRAEALAKALVARDRKDVEAAQLLSTLTLWSEGPEAARAALAGVALEDAPPHLLAEMLSFHEGPTADLLERVRAQASRDGEAPQVRADLWFALAQHYDRVGDADAAWVAAEHANMLAPARARQDWRGVLAAHLRIFRETALASDASGPNQFYLLGTPRSGQSLLQSMLAAAPGVVSLGERGALLQHLLFRTGEVATMSSPARAQFFGRLGEADRRGIARLAADATLVVDKSPLHLPIAGTVARVHPGAAFAAVVRDPADTALSIWLRSFPPIYDYANDFHAVLDQLDFALDALAAWREAGVGIDLIDHAELVTNPAHVGGKVFARLGIDWDEAYLDPASRTQPVPTFSAAQVRKPISASVSRSATDYLDRLDPFAERLEILRARTRALLD